MAEDQLEEWQRLRDEFHMVMGYCIAAWAEVDDQLFRIFQNCLATLDELSAIIYYARPALIAALA